MFKNLLNLSIRSSSKFSAESTSVIFSKNFHKSTINTSTPTEVEHTYTKENHEDTPFEFSPENEPKIKEILKKYPLNYQKGAIMPLLDLAQKQNGGWLPLAAMNKVALICDVVPMKVYEVASFYSMYNRLKMGKHHVKVCTTTPCMLRGAYDILDVCKKHLDIGVGQTTKDGLFTLGEVECAGCCVNAPMIAIDEDYYEDVDEKSTIDLLTRFAKGEKVAHGPMNDRKNSEGPLGRTTLHKIPPPPPCTNLD